VIQKVNCLDVGIDRTRADYEVLMPIGRHGVNRRPGETDKQSGHESQQQPGDGMASQLFDHGLVLSVLCPR
jgi:hypothetical protein